MKKFISKICLFLFPVLCMVILMEAALRKIPNDYLLKRNYLDVHSNEIETLILGSSHNFYGLNPVYFTTKTFNAAYLTQSLDYDYAILKKYENKFASLKTVVLDISYFSLYSRLETSFWIKNYVLYYGMDATTRSVNNYFELLNGNVFSSCGRLYRYYIRNHVILRCSPSGWGNNYRYSSHRNLIATGKEAAKRHERDVDAAKNKNYFEKKLCHIAICY